MPVDSDLIDCPLKKRCPCLPILCAVSTELSTLLWGELDNNESINASLLAILDNTLLAIAANGVEVSHEDDRGLETLGSCFSDHVKAHRDIDIVTESDLEERIVASVNQSFVATRGEDERWIE